MRTLTRRRRGARTGCRRGPGDRADRRGDRRRRRQLPGRDGAPGSGPGAASRKSGDPAGDRHRGGVPTGNRPSPRRRWYGTAGGADASFDPGNIASDEVFYNTASMTLDQITAFIDEQNAGCDGAWCLRTPGPGHRQLNRRTPTARPTPAEPAQSAAKMLFDFSRACGINPQVMLDHAAEGIPGADPHRPTASSWAAAWGWHCPDTGPGGTANCDPAHAGFVNQGYGMANQWARYRIEIPNGSTTTGPGAPTTSLWNVAESGCGGAPVTIANMATASLYNYTPYQPNPASLAAYPGEGDRCSTYGNRNFFRMYQTYFGSTGGGIATGAPTAVGGGGSAGTIGAVPVVTSGATVTIPASPYAVWRGKDYAGTVITAPTPGIAAGIAAGFAYLGLQYSWGGGNAERPHPGHPRRRQGGRRPR